MLAGAGSGETRVIANKSPHLIRGSVIRRDISRRCTFTDKAAREMKSVSGRRSVAKRRAGWWGTGCARWGRDLMNASLWRLG
ncbi:UvrD-helicase domain-containing protein [Escherichia coli]